MFRFISQSSIPFKNFNLSVFRRVPAAPYFLVQRRLFWGEESINAKSFEQEYVRFFNEECEDAFEVERGLTNCFDYDIVPPVTILEAALKAARRHDNFAAATRLFWALRGKVDNEAQYVEYVQYLQPLMDELGVVTPFSFGRHEIMQ